MRKGVRLLMPLSLILLSACSSGAQTPTGLVIATGSIPTWTMEASANYYYNIKKESFAIDSYAGQANDMLYQQVKITPPCQLVAPATNPTRENYTFTGWFTNSECTALWDFANAKAETSVFLYAGWARTGEGDYAEPAYTPPENIDDTLENNLSLNGVLNVAPTYGVVYLTKGGMLRLEKDPSNVIFALNYTQKKGTSIKSAVYDANAKTITVVSLNGAKEETDSIGVELTSANLALSNTTYESKAAAYEQAGATSENYHIMLAGSSSIEFWDSYAHDLAPIVAYNHGIGGTVATDWSSVLLDRLVVPYCPKAIVYYVGVNDIVNANNDAKTVAANVEKLLDDTHAKLPYAHVFFVYVNLLPGYYLSYEKTIADTNTALASYIKEKDWVEGVDAGKALLKATGHADAGYFRLDNLHMSEYGYVLWAGEIKKALKAWLG